MAYIKIWVHLVWSTHNRQEVLIKEKRQQIFDHIRQNAQEKGIYIDHINGHLDHVHCLLSLGSGQNIDKILMLLKGESSYWINKQKILPSRFEWQDEYFAVSFGESSVTRVREYIRNQEKHHPMKTFEEEYQEFISKYNFGLKP
jgi:putative transposase